jgi:ATP-dependent RNA helicase DDX27
VEYCLTNRILILQPTRELAAQCYSMLENLCKYLPQFTHAMIMGGTSIQKQELQLKERPDCIVATTGRLLDHIKNTKAFHLEDVDVLVLDEADKLLEQGGFMEELKQIINALGGEEQKRQTILLSATLNTQIKEIAGLMLKNNPVRIDQKQIEEARITHYIVRMKPEEMNAGIKRVKMQIRLIRSSS